jgi:hypothetical protein
MILRGEEERHLEREAQQSGDDWSVEADGSGADGGGRGARARLLKARQLCVVEAVRGETPQRAGSSNASGVRAASLSQSANVA